MATDVYLSVAGAGAKTGVDTANAYSVVETQNAFDDALGGGAGSNLYIQTGTYSINTNVGALIDLDGGAGTAAALNYAIAVNGSWVEDGSVAIFDGETALVNVFKLDGAVDYTEFRGITAINATNQALDHAGAGVSQKIYFYNCSFESSAIGLDTGNNDLQIPVFNNCEFSGNSGSGLHGVNGNVILQNCNLSNNLNGWSNSTGAVFLNCLVYGNTTANCGGGTAIRIINCIIDGTRGGTNTVTGVVSTLYILANSRVTNHSGWGVTPGDNFTSINNYFYANTSGDINETTYDYLGGQYDRLSGVNSSDGYEDASAGDYTLTAGEDGVGVSIPTGTVDETTNLGYITQGIAPEYASGGGGGNLIDGSLII